MDESAQFNNKLRRNNVNTFGMKNNILSPFLGEVTFKLQNENAKIKACEKIRELTDKYMSYNPAKLKGLDYYNSLHNKYKIKKNTIKLKYLK